MVDNSGFAAGGLKAGDNYREVRVNLRKTEDASFDTSSNVTTPFGLNMSPDGTILSVIQGSGSPQRLHSYTLSSAWDITSMSHNGSYDPSAQSSAPRGLAYNSDGTKIIVCDGTNRALYQYTAGTAYRVDTISGYDSVTLDVSSECTFPLGCAFGDSGSKLYVIDNSGIIYQYNLSTPYVISSGVYSNNSFDTNVGIIVDLTLSSDGSKFFTVGGGDDTAVEFKLNTPWDISTGSDTGFRISGGSIDNDPQGIFLGDSGTKLYIAGDTTDSIYQFNLDSANTLSKTVLNLTSQKHLITGIGIESANKQGLTGNVRVAFQATIDGGDARPVGPLYSSYTSSVSEALQNPVYYPYLVQPASSSNIKASYTSEDIDAVVFYNLK